MKNINQILKFLDIQTLSQNNFQIESLSLDSRKCDDKWAFVALKGQLTDGNKYIDSVLAKDISLVLTDSHEFEDQKRIFYIQNLKEKLSALAKWFYDYKKPQNIIGITGTNGKTSISSYIAQFLDLSSQKTLLLGTNGNGIYPDLKESTHTTLDILSLYQTISYHKNYQNLVMEVSSHSLDQKRTEGLDFDVAVFSNLSHDHLDYHKSMDNYFEAKAKLFQFKSLKKAIINIDDEYGQRLCNITKVPIITVSLKSEYADVYIKPKSIEGIKTKFEMFFNGRFVGEYTTKLIGDFNLMNLGLSFASLDGVLDWDCILDLGNIKSVKGRMEVIELDNDIKIVIDYAHTPDALEKALQTLANYNPNNLWCIFGCGGNRDTTKRPIMAQIAEEYASKIVVTEDNNRFENIENIFSDIKKGFKYPQKHTFITSREQAIRFSIENANQGDIILLAGKGHECYLDKNGIKEYFDEREIIKNML
ncbi:UDP-N-acetylmuramoyl-L-alanyl-D-glutamate--2,6-diaminopimelate ligase [Francisella hispaniensis]|uniref:UDP-N-acetylmuramyl-tripeptide synthetase n=1 Tax=Francisella hispaniensis TaxID=622488 RepID=F4BJJ3_9GAMM|nr:UDP-N-acetylmuramoyl-L-alanyl-D-glutamate--2,6-diaminopimelate ligase [Francisella hispaniensis]AEB28337.1 UDP-N-acetylmuramoylalanyl-D-glutamate--2,6-diaminopimelate ligase [Francisella hispaniensis]